MIESFTFQNDTNKNLTFVQPLIYVTKEIGGILYNKGFSLQQLNFVDHEDNPLFYSPLLLSMPSLTEKIDIEKKKYTISNLQLTLSNMKYNGVRLSDSHNELINASIYIYYKTQNAQILEDCLKVYHGKIIRVRHNMDEIRLNIEDATQIELHKDLPFNKLPDNETITEEYRLQPFPIVYGTVEKSPLLKYSKEIYIEEEEEVGDEQLEKITTKIYLAPDAIDSEFVEEEEIKRIYGYINYKMNVKSYEVGSRDYYETPIYIHDGDFSRVVNRYETVDGETNEENDVFIKSDNVFYLEKFSNENNQPLNNLAGNYILSTIKPKIHTPYASNIKNSHNYIDNPSSSFRLPKVPEKLYKTFRDHGEVSGGYGKDNNNDNFLDIQPVTEENYGEEYAQYSGIDKIFDYNETTYFIANVFNDLSAPSPYFRQPFFIGFKVEEVKYNYSAGVPILYYKGILTAELNGAARGTPFFVATSGSTAKAEWLNEDLSNSNLPTPSFSKSFFGTTLIDNEGQENESFIDNIGIDDMGFFVISNAAQDTAPTIVNWYIDSFDLRYHMLKRKENLLAKSDFYADVIGRNKTTGYEDKEYYLKDFFVTIDSNIVGVENFTNSNYGIYYNNNGLSYIRGYDYEIDDTFKIYVDYIELRRSPQDGKIIIHFNGVIETENDGNVGDMDENLLFSGEALVSFAYENNNTVSFFSPYFSNINIGTIEIAPLTSISEIMTNIVVDECKYSGTILEEDINDAKENHKFWKFAFTVHKTINSKKLLENFAMSSKSIARFRGSNGNFVWTTIKDEYDENDVDVTINSDDVLWYSFERTRLEDVKTKVKVNYNKDYSIDKLSKETEYVYADQLTYTEESGTYNYDYYGLVQDDKDSTLDFKSEFIRDEGTATQLRNYLLSWHMNQHNVIKIQLPLRYVNLEVGDVVEFNKEISGMKLFGEFYTTNMQDLGQGYLEDAHLTYRNGQLIYPYFMITKTIKKLDKIVLEMVQLHKNDFNYFLPPVENGDDLIIQPTGDVNFDGNVDVLDIVGIVSFIMDVVAPTQDQFNEADVNGDGNIDVLDVVTVVSAILDG